MAYKLLIKLGLLNGTIGTAIYYREDVSNIAVGGLRFGRAAKTVLSIVFDYRKTLYAKDVSVDFHQYATEKSKAHLRSASKLLDLCCLNGGAFIKVGQHIGSLDYLLPQEYVSTLKVLHSEAPKSSLESVYAVIKRELKQEWSEIFTSFDAEPLGAASLAQVHKAVLKNGKEVAVKVQHPEVMHHSIIDMKGMEMLVKLVSKIFPEFRFQWLVNEIKINLPKELDFYTEGKNAEAVSKMFAHYPWLKVPSIEWDLSTSRVLTMDFFDGGKVDDLNYFSTHGINRHEVTDKLGKLYAEMIFVTGFVHCDPHPGNILIKKNGDNADVILLDHGLYLSLTEQFRISYAKFWQCVLNADLQGIEEHSKGLGVGDLYSLFACMVTGRSWDSISAGIDKKKISNDELRTIKKDAEKYVPEIVEVLARVPREMILIFKTNDCIRGIEHSLKTNLSMKSFISMSRCCVVAVYNDKRKYCSSMMCLFTANLCENFAQFKLHLYVCYLWCRSFKVSLSTILW